MDIIICAWKLRKGFKLETMTIPQKHIDFANDNMARIVAAENDAIMDMKRKMEMKKHNVDWN